VMILPDFSFDDLPERNFGKLATTHFQRLL